MNHQNTLEFLREAAYTMYRESSEFPDVLPRPPIAINCGLLGKFSIAL